MKEKKNESEENAEDSERAERIWWESKGVKFGLVDETRALYTSASRGYQARHKHN